MTETIPLFGEAPAPRAPRRPPIKKTCEQCRAVFLARASKAEKARFCSRECQSANHRGSSHRKVDLRETERRCRKCGVIKLIDEYEKHPRYKNGRVPQCRACRAEQRATLNQRRPRVPRGESKTCAGCGDVRPLVDFSRDARSPDGYSPRCVVCRRAWRRQPSAGLTPRDRHLMWKYGVDSSWYEAKIEEQGDACAACGKAAETERHGRLHIDHCHSSGELRGLLCNGCNLALGLLRDDAVRIDGLAAYVRSYPTTAGAPDPSRDTP